ncbi:MAG TPA: hypothetical protein EYG54_08380 [Myxococcales bacterium]|nr:hypothetical protein [Myxococcales bacterium]
MLQFQSPWRLRVFGEIRRPPEAKRVVARTVEDNALVVFSLVERNTVEVMQREAQPSLVDTMHVQRCKMGLWNSYPHPISVSRVGREAMLGEARCAMTWLVVALANPALIIEIDVCAGKKGEPT